MGEPILSSTLLLPGDEDPLTQAEDVMDRLGPDLAVVIDSGVPGVVPTSVLDFTGRFPEAARVGAGDVARFLDEGGGGQRCPSSVLRRAERHLDETDDGS